MRLFLFIVLLLTMSCRTAARPDAAAHVILSYQEYQGGCANCPYFRVEFREPDLVTFHGLAGCAVPGESTYRIPAGEFTALWRAFHDAGFFGLPRTLPVRWIDTMRTTLAYRDDRRVHETVRTGPKDPVLGPLGERLRRAARADAFLTPSLAKYHELVRNGWDVNTRGEDHENALTATIWGGDEASVRFLLARGSSVTDGGLFAAASRDEPVFARLLLAAIDEPRKRRLLGPLLLTAARSDAITRELVTAGADVNWREPSTGRTPLVAAIEHGSLDRAAFLLTHGASPSAADRNGRTPLHAAAAAYNTGFIPMLSSRGASVNAQDREGRTPLMVAADGCYDWNVTPLLAAGARLDLADNRGRTALQPQWSVVGDPKCQRTADLMRAAVAVRRTSHIR